MTLKYVRRLNHAEYIATTPIAAETYSHRAFSASLCLRASALSQQFPHYPRRLDASELGIESLKLERQPLMIQAEQMQDGGV
jgi:hypothetical protein